MEPAHRARQTLADGAPHRPPYGRVQEAPQARPLVGAVDETLGILIDNPETHDDAGNIFACHHQEPVGVKGHVALHEDLVTLAGDALTIARGVIAQLRALETAGCWEPSR